MACIATGQKCPCGPKDKTGGIYHLADMMSADLFFVPDQMVSVETLDIMDDRQ